MRVPSPLSTQVLSRTLELHRLGRPFEAIRAVRQGTTIELAVAKAFVYHLTTQVGRCHRCTRALSEGEAVCSHCRSLNLDYPAAA